MSENSQAIGTRNESSLHKALKFHYTGSEGSTEIAAASYICDGRTGTGELIEVQCGSFGPLKEKVKTLTQKNKLKVVHPIIALKYIEIYDVSGSLIAKRKSPRKGSAWDLFYALVYAPQLPLHKNFKIELAIIESVEKRIDDGKGSWRRGGISITDRTVGAWRGFVVLSKPSDYYQFIPFEKEKPFTVRQLAEKAGINAGLARKTLHVLTTMGLAKRTGKQKNAVIYVRV